MKTIVFVHTIDKCFNMHHCIGSIFFHLLIKNLPLLGQIIGKVKLLETFRPWEGFEQNMPKFATHRVPLQ